MSAEGMSALPATFGKYFLTEKIATGGMAEIFLAKLIGPGGFEKQLIIKKIHPKFSGQRQFVELFVAEAKTLVGLSHGNIVPIYELGMVESSYFIAMEYIDGPSLERLCERSRKAGERISPVMAAHICTEVLKGLDYAHRKGDGVIHRDLSPRNVMISREGEVKLVDFGIAVALASDGSQSEDAVPAGSPPYMSPEQAQAKSLDARSDLFAVGILLWEMLCGRSLFARDTDLATLDAVMHDEVEPPSAHCPEAAGVLDVICAKALTRDRDQRYGSAREFLIALQRYLYSHADPVAPSDLSQVVALHCPPEHRRAPSRAPSRSERAGDGTVRMDRTQAGGTQPMKRDIDEEDSTGGSESTPGTRPMARGKSRADTVRSFATNVQFEKVLAKATPFQGVPIIAPEPSDEPGAPNPAIAPGSETAAPSPVDTDEKQDAPPEKGSLETATTQSHPPPRLLRTGLIVASSALIGGLLFYLVSRDETRGPTVAKSAAADAGPADAAFSAVDATPGPSVDAAPPMDAAPAAKADARPRKARQDAAPKARALGTVRVGANPWAEVFVEGKRLGRAPGAFELPAGTHELELRNGEQSRRVTVTVTADEVISTGLIDMTIAP